MLNVKEIRPDQHPVIQPSIHRIDEFHTLCAIKMSQCHYRNTGGGMSRTERQFKTSALPTMFLFVPYMEIVELYKFLHFSTYICDLIDVFVRYYVHYIIHVLIAKDPKNAIQSL